MQAILRQAGRRKHALIVVAGAETPEAPLFFAVRRDRDGKYLSDHGHWHSQKDKHRASGFSMTDGGLAIEIDTELADCLVPGHQYRLTFGQNPSMPLTFGEPLPEDPSLEEEGHAPKTGAKEGALTFVTVHHGGKRALILAVVSFLVLVAVTILYWNVGPRHFLTAARPIAVSNSVNATVESMTFTLAEDKYRYDPSSFSLSFAAGGLEADLKDSLSKGASGAEAGSELLASVPTSFSAFLNQSAGGSGRHFGVELSLPGTADPAGTAAADRELSLRVLRQTAENGSTEAMLMLARYYDPLVEQGGDRVRDPHLAREWYRRAAACGLAEADLASEALMNYLMEQAEEGNSEAMSLLRLW